MHIIRLDGIQDKSYKPFEEVQEKIVADLKDGVDEYRRSQ